MEVDISYTWFEAMVDKYEEYEKALKELIADDPEDYQRELLDL